MIEFSSNPNSTLNQARMRLYEAKQAFGGHKSKDERSKATRDLNHARIALKEVAYYMRGKQYKPQKSVYYHFQTRARGVPCGVVIGDLDDDGCNFYLTDLDGYPAQWLEDKLDYHDRCRIIGKCYDFYRYRKQLRKRGIVHDD